MLLLLLFEHNGPRDVISGDDDDESLMDFFESLLFELDRAICLNINISIKLKITEILSKTTNLNIFSNGRFFGTFFHIKIDASIRFSGNISINTL